MDISIPNPDFSAMPERSIQSRNVAWAQFKVSTSISNVRHSVTGLEETNKYQQIGRQNIDQNMAGSRT
jgi:hypothetical protein